MAREEFALHGGRTRAQRIGPRVRPHDFRGPVVSEQLLEGFLVRREPGRILRIEHRPRRQRHVLGHDIEMQVDRHAALCGDVGQHLEQRMVGRDRFVCVLRAHVARRQMMDRDFAEGDCARGQCLGARAEPALCIFAYRIERRVVYQAVQRAAASITARPELELIACHTTGKAAIAGLAQRAPDVLLVDLGLPDISGLDVIRYAAQHYPECDVLVVSIFGDEEHVLAALQAGARGYLLKGALTRDIALDVRELRTGGSPLSPIIARRVLTRLQAPAASLPVAPVADTNEEALTAREIDILRTIARGFSYAETAALLKISVQTVHTHLKRIYRKLAVHSKTEAIFEAGERRLL